MLCMIIMKGFSHLIKNEISKRSKIFGVKEI